MLDMLEVKDDQPGWPDKFGQALHAWVEKNRNIAIETLSLFSGGGGLDIAFHSSGFEIKGMVESDTRFVETLELNSQKGSLFHGSIPMCVDIREYSPTKDSHIDFIIGGPPCQTFSAAGRRAAGVSGVDDPRGTLFQEYVRILDELRPRGFLFENVYGIVGAQGGKPLDQIVDAFKSIGYQVSYRILDTADYGAPQHRERLIIVGSRNGTFVFPRPTHGPDSPDNRPFYTANLAVKGVKGKRPGPVGGRFGHLLVDIPPGLNYSFYTEEMGHPTPIFAWRSKFSDFLYKADPDMPVRTIKAYGGLYTGPFHWNNRPFSIGELKRLQTFPDDYVLSGGPAAVIQQIGNSVPPQFARILAVSVANQFFGLDFPFEIDYVALGEKLGFRARKRHLSDRYRTAAARAIENQYGDEAQRKSVAVAGPSRHTHAKEYVFEAYLGPKFQWFVRDEEYAGIDREWNVLLTIGENSEQIEFHIDELQSPQAEESCFIIQVKPVSSWNVPFTEVLLSTGEPTPLSFTAIWKAFESYLSKRSIKADLVQLNGYYQYKPKIGMRVIDLEQQLESTIWPTVRQVVEGVGVREILRLVDLAAAWNASLRETTKALLMLRSLGYEVRSEHTNSQIPKGHILIPYSFPTLNPKSVQLGKALFPDTKRE
jgi:DNA (cytosine-5)-methyltransferase 1